MGANGSRPSSDISPSQHIFKADHPVRISEQLRDSLQDSPQTDGSRAAITEQKIQARVTDQLRQLEKQESQRLKELTDRAASETEPSDDDSSPSSSKTKKSSTSFFGSNKDDGGKKDVTRARVADEIAALKGKLERYREQRERQAQANKDSGVTEAVEKAKGELVTCLRTKDRRPLDCWAEVEAFRGAVGRLEGEFMRDAVR